MPTIPDLHVGHGITAAPVTMFPVWADALQLRNVVTGTAARVSVTELPDGAAIPHLTVTNLGPKPALLLEGELLEGGLQTRALAFDLLIAPRTSAVVDVASASSCSRAACSSISSSVLSSGYLSTIRAVPVRVTDSLEFSTPVLITGAAGGGGVTVTLNALEAALVPAEVVSVAVNA